MAISIIKFPRTVFSLDFLYFMIALGQGLFLIYITPEIAKYVLPKINACLVSDFDQSGEAIGTRIVQVDDVGECQLLPEKYRMT